MVSPCPSISSGVYCNSNCIIFASVPGISTSSELGQSLQVVLFLVLQVIANRTEPTIAESTFIYSFASVGRHMLCQADLLSEFLITNVACIFYSFVGRISMHSHLVPVLERFATRWTSAWVHGVRNPLVLDQSKHEQATKIARNFLPIRIVSLRHVLL